MADVEVCRVGSALNVILADISFPMLEHAHELADRNGGANQCGFVRCPADGLNNIDNTSVDSVVSV